MTRGFMKKELEQKLLMNYSFLRPKQDPKVLKSNLRISAHDYCKNNEEGLKKSEDNAVRALKESKTIPEYVLNKNFLKLIRSIKKYNEDYNPAVDKNTEVITDLLVFGIDVKDGWYNLLDVLCSEIQKELDKAKQTIEVKQVKEKFGRLCFYYSDPNNNQEISKLVRNAEILSAYTCEACGGKVKHVKGLRFYTLCPDHEKLMLQGRLNNKIIRPQSADSHRLSKKQMALFMRFNNLIKKSYDKNG